MGRDFVGVVEAAYSIHGDAREWLLGVVHAAEPFLDRGKGVYGFCFDASDPHDFQIRDFAVPTGTVVVPDLVERWHRALSPAQVYGMYRGSRQYASIGERLGVGDRIEDVPAMKMFCRALGVFDQLTVRAADSTARGATIVAPTSEPEHDARSERLWTRIAAHVAAGFRLRSALAEVPAAGPTDSADAVYDAAGRRLHATGDAQDEAAHAGLRHAVLAMDRARGALRRSDPDEAVDIWRGLVDGRWSLVEHFESDGRRVILARQNAPGGSDPLALGQREQEIVRYVALGHTTKETAYALGIGAATVSSHLASAMRKLGVSTRVELLDLLTRVSLGNDTRSSK